jgi:hypothetical protein
VSELSPTARLALDALWSHGHVHGHGRVTDVRDWLGGAGHRRSLSTVRRALQQLVEHDYAKRYDVRYGEHGRPCAHYYATRRYGETLPAVCDGSRWLTWLWTGRLSWELWRLELSERMAWIDNWGMQATPEEWAWLLSRSLDFASGPPTPDDPAWWEDTDSDDSASVSPAERNTACGARRPSQGAGAVIPDSLEGAVAPLLTEPQMREQLDISPRELRELAALGGIIELHTRRGERLFPAWQLGDDGRPLEALAKAHRTLVRDGMLSPWSAAVWCLSLHHELAERTPLAWAHAREDPEHLALVAWRDASRAAQ